MEQNSNHTNSQDTVQETVQNPETTQTQSPAEAERQKAKEDQRRNRREKRACMLLASRGQEFALLLLRVFFGIMMLMHGLDKAENFSALSTTFPNPLGLGSWFTLLLITSVEIGASVLIILGLLTRIAALALVIAMCVAAFFAPPAFSLAASELPLLYLAVYVILLITGAGKYSVDSILRRIYCPKESQKRR